jgi:hypothetical protein
MFTLLSHLGFWETFFIWFINSYSEQCIDRYGSYDPTEGKVHEFVQETLWCQVHSWTCWNRIQCHKFRMQGCSMLWFSNRMEPLLITHEKYAISLMQCLAICGVVGKVQYHASQFFSSLFQLTFPSRVMLRMLCIASDLIHCLSFANLLWVHLP